MLKLKNIVKDYQAGDTTVRALKGINIEFRKSEFVAILGPSGCGKTTLLNIVGGLDQYTSGDLVINGKSTKDFKDHDWDTYRNHSIGFVFQNYNLIPHQTVLANVELALTLSGVSKAERREKAKKVLEQVGLSDQMMKKPNQMSGGQMQRVAIARALINDPDILLADEPTGALDSETSVQIMEILKEISHDKLIIMVTHNPDLADRYATRVVRLLDGSITDDTAPYSEGELKASDVKQKKPSMSFFTALSLSLNNLMTKKTRTFLTAFAGSIGIIGIALILSLSTGIQTYIDEVQEDTLSSYPISIAAENVDMTSLMTSLMGAGADAEKEKHELDAVYSNTIMYELMNSIMFAETETNNLADFKEYLDDPDSPIHDYLSAYQYSYDTDFNIYTSDTGGNIVKSDLMSIIENAWSSVGTSTAMMPMDMMSSYTNFDIWDEMIPGEGDELVHDLIKEQYDVIYGSWPKAYNEVVLVVDKNNELSDMALYALGLKDTSDFQELMAALVNGEEFATEQERWSYEDICGTKFKLILSSEYWQYDETTGSYIDLSLTHAGLDFLYNSSNIGTDIKIVGIIRPNEDAVSTSIAGSIAYTTALTEYVVNTTAASEIVSLQKENPDTDIITGLPFMTENYVEPTDDEKTAAITEYISTISPSEKASVYTAVMSEPGEAYLSAAVNEYMSQVTREYIEEVLIEAYAQEMNVDASTVADYIAEMDDATLFASVEETVRETIRQQYAQGVQAQLSQLTVDQQAMALDAGGFTAEQYLFMYENYMPATVSESTYEENLELLGCVDINSPSEVYLYSATFEDKDMIADCIDDYNRTKAEEDQISYTDYVGLLMSSITTIINAISYVLIAFVAISLVVSSIMIGIITYISVLERTKEIGILRSIGASKRDISRVFNAETLIEGFVSGAMGIGVSLLLTIPINMIVQHFTGIPNLRAILPVNGAVILVIISMLLTFIAGLVPAKIAAKRDPVIALRSE